MEQSGQHTDKYLSHIWSKEAITLLTKWCRNMSEGDGNPFGTQLKGWGKKLHQRCNFY